MGDTEIEKIIDIAKKARERAYAPYSRFKVGVALVAEDSRVYTGVNCENASLGLSICAERVAVFKAVSEGRCEFRLLIIVTDSTEPVLPCGACRQVLFEFSPKLKIVSIGADNKRRETSLEEILPDGFTLEG